MVACQAASSRGGRGAVEGVARLAERALALRRLGERVAAGLGRLLGDQLDLGVSGLGAAALLLPAASVPAGGSRLHRVALEHVAGAHFLLCSQGKSRC